LIQPPLSAARIAGRLSSPQAAAMRGHWSNLTASGLLLSDDESGVRKIGPGQMRVNFNMSNAMQEAVLQLIEEQLAQETIPESPLGGNENAELQASSSENGRSPTRLLVLLAAFGMFSLAPQAATQYWDGAGVENDSIVTGGPGVWDSGATNWTTADGLTNSVWGQDEAVFYANAGAVIISGKVLTQRLSFITDGYVLAPQDSGSGLTFLGDLVIDTADGVTATINTSVAQQTFGTDNNLYKTGAGTLVLNGEGSFGGKLTVDGEMIVAGNIGHYGGTWVNNGAVLQIGNGGGSGMVDFGIVNNGTLIFNRSDDFSFSGGLDGVGDTIKRGAGTLYLLTNNLAQGTTTIEQGTLSIGDGINDSHRLHG
jgi:autotransporter-associated beta strand protein